LINANTNIKYIISPAPFTKVAQVDAIKNYMLTKKISDDYYYDLNQTQK